MESVLGLIDKGGVAVLAVVIWYELRLFRLSMTRALSHLSEEQAVLAERTRVVHDRVLGFKPVIAKKDVL